MPTIWSNDPGFRTAPDPAYQDQGFDPVLPLPIAFLNWKLWDLDTRLTDVEGDYLPASKFAVEHNGTTGEHTDIDAITVDASGQITAGGGFGSSGVTLTSGGSVNANGTGHFDGSLATDNELTHGDAKNSFVLTPELWLLHIDPLFDSTPAPAGYNYASGLGFQFLNLTAATDDKGSVWQIPVPIGARVDYMDLRILTPAGGVNTGNIEAILIRRVTALGGSSATSHTITLSAPAAGNVSFDFDALSFAVADENTSFFLVVRVHNTGNDDDAVSFVGSKVRWTFNQPGDF